MKICVLSANLGGYDKPVEWVEDQDLPENGELEIIRLNESNYPPRPLAMTSRLQCGIPKMFGWTMTDADVILWLDASCALTDKRQLMRWLYKLGMSDLALFAHPERSTIRDEFQFVLTRMARPNETYLNSRYAGEDIAGMYRRIQSDAGYIDDTLYASTAFMYRNNERVREMLTKWFAMKAAFCLHDQFALPWLVKRSGCSVSMISDNYMKSDLITFVRPSKTK